MEYSAHWIQRLVSVTGVEVAIDRAVMQELQVPLGLRSLQAARPLYPMGTVLNQNFKTRRLLFMGPMRLAMPGRGKRRVTLQECQNLLKKTFIEKDRGEIFTGRIEEAYCSPCRMVNHLPIRQIGLVEVFAPCFTGHTCRVPIQAVVKRVKWYSLDKFIDRWDYLEQQNFEKQKQDLCHLVVSSYNSYIVKQIFCLQKRYLM